MGKAEWLSFDDLVEELKSRCDQVVLFSVRKPLKPTEQCRAEFTSTAKKEAIKVLHETLTGLLPHLPEDEEEGE